MGREALGKAPHKLSLTSCLQEGGGERRRCALPSFAVPPPQAENSRALFWVHPTLHLLL